MTRCARIVGAVGLSAALAVAAPVAVGRPGTPAQVFRGAVDSVELNVAVTAGGKPVEGLTAGDFAVTDNGVRQVVTSVSHDTVPIDITLVADTSASTAGPLSGDIVSAIGRIHGRLRPQDRFSLVTFNQVIHERVALAPPSSVNTVSLGRLIGATALNDAMAVTLTAPPAVDRRAMMIVFTDGFDTLSLLDDESVILAAGHSRMAVFMVAEAASTSTVPVAFFQRVADVTGGLVEIVKPVGRSDPSVFGGNRTKGDLLGPSFVKAIDDFRTSYVVRYTLEGVPPAGWHDVSVRVTRPGQSYSVRARKGYAG